MLDALCRIAASRLHVFCSVCFNEQTFSALVHWVQKVIEDPPCILSASRDLSVKLRALPNQNDYGSNNHDDQASTATANTSTAATREGPDNINNNVSSSSKVLPFSTNEGQQLYAANASVAALLRSGSSLCSVSSSCPKLPPYGRDLSTLTLGRVGDGFRRDVFVFPVDLKGRGEGRAVEARAVLQVGLSPKAITDRVHPGIYADIVYDVNGSIRLFSV